MLLYASKYHDIRTVVNVSGRYDLKGGIEDRLGKDYMEKIMQDGFIDVKNKTGKNDFLSNVVVYYLARVFVWPMMTG